MITPPSSPYANAVAPFVPLGREPVGQENTELKLSTLKPMEQPADTGRSENRRSPDERPNEVDEQQRLREERLVDGDQNKQKREQKDEEHKKKQEEVERDMIRELAARDREVRAHEQAHAAVGGHHAGSPVYQYQRGPDGISYAVGGEVSISTSPIPGDPEATIRKAQQIARAATAPADPSPQDRRVAADAVRLEAEARAEIQQRDALEKAQQAEALERVEQARQDEKARQERGVQAKQDSGRASAGGENPNQTIDVTRRLADIGVFNVSSPIGRLVDHQV